MTIGCCGYGGPRRFSLSGFLAEADAYPPSSPQGQAARARLAYGIAAGKAAQAGNRPAYERAMRGLAGLGTGSPTPGFHGDASAARAQITAAVSAAAPSPVSLSATLTGISGYVDLVASLATLGTSIAQSSGGDQNTIDAINTVVSWLRSILTGAVPTVPTLSDSMLNGFVDFCRIKTQMTNVLYPLLDGVILTLRGVAVRDAGAREAADALTLIKSRVVTLLDGICRAPQIAAAMAASMSQTCADGSVIPSSSTCATDAQCRASDPNTIAHGAGCACANGLLDPARPYMGCRPVAGTPGPTAAVPAIGLELGVGGCTSGVHGGGPGRFNLIPPAGIYNPTTGSAVPGTAGSKSCAACSAPAVFIPGVVDARGFWATPPGCQNPATGAIISAPRTGPCPAGTSRTSSGGCAGAAGGGGGGSGGSSKAIPLAAAAAAAAWFFFK